MLSVKEAAIKIGVSERQLRFLLKNGEIEGIKLSRDWVVLSLDYQRKRKPKTRRKQ
jgi:hypothetical protein